MHILEPNYQLAVRPARTAGFVTSQLMTREHRRQVFDMDGLNAVAIGLSTRPAAQTAAHKRCKILVIGARSLRKFQLYVVNTFSFD